VRTDTARAGAAYGSEIADYAPTVRDTLPFQKAAVIDLSGAVYADAAEHVEEVAERLGPWYARTPARLGGSWAGLEYADLALGEEILFTAERFPLFGIAEAVAGTRYTEHPALVTSHEVDWQNHRVKMTLHLLPPEA
jgi:hypothetical protein